MTKQDLWKRFSRRAVCGAIAGMALTPLSLRAALPQCSSTRIPEERPDAAGIAVPGVPLGSSGMGGKSRPYSVVLFGSFGRRTYMQSLGTEVIG